MNRDRGLDPIVRHLGRCDYEPTWRRMQALTEDRGEDDADEIWFLEHPPVYTVGLNGNMAHVLNPAEIPVINIDRGGQVTYHGPGQLVVYPLLDLRRRRLGVRNLVEALESAVVDYVAEFGIEAAPRRDAPGVYVEGAKLAALGLRIRRGCSYHGLAFNVAMDLSPFHGINPCGFEGLDVTQLSDLGGPSDLDEVARGLEPHLMRHLARRDPVGS